METIPAFFSRSVAARGGEQAVGFVHEGELRWRTWSELAADVAAQAEVIRSCGVRPGDAVSHVSENRYEWIVTDLAIHVVGAVHVPVHVTLSGEQIAHQINDSAARLVFVSNAELLEKFRALIDPNVEVRLYGPRGEENPFGAGEKWSESIAHPSRPDDLATILYTSGTTGRPRGVMLSQSNLASNAATSADLISPDVEQVRLCILPLSHIFARTCDLYTWVYRGNKLVLAESRETTIRDLALVKPNALNAVPYVFQRVADKVVEAAPPDPAAALRGAFGGRMEYLMCGGAPLSLELGAWYDSHQFPVLVGYGLTETSPVVSASTHDARRTGRSGRIIPGVEVRIDDDGEILVRGPNIMLGYWKDAEATAEAIRDGWFYTGDLGDLDGEGFLAISGRKKELIVLSTGKKVVPTAVENRLAASPKIEQAAIFGDGDSAIVALIVPTAEARAEDRASLGEEIARCLASAAKEEQVRDFAILDRPFSIDRGEMTAKLSLCRTQIAENFAEELQEMRDRARSLSEAKARPRLPGE